MSLCAVRGCGKSQAVGMRLCSDHLAQAESAHASAKEMSSQDCRRNADPYDAALSMYVDRISSSEQMRKLTRDLIEGGVKDAVDSFPGLAAIPPETVEQLVSFLAVNVVSSIIQDRAHLLARATMLADALSAEQAHGLRQMMELEMEIVNECGVDKM